MAVPFLPGRLPPSALLAVEIAWGADLAAASATWTWTDVTTDVRASDGITTKHGRSDEAGSAQPASCSMVLNNTSGAYSLGGHSPNWPNVRQNTPVRVRIDPGDGGGYRVVFIGYADSWTPTWDQSARVATVQLTASGILRRLQQNTSPVLSSLRRRLSFESNVVAYWPLEEGKDSTQGGSRFSYGAPMNTFGRVEFASDTDSFPSALQMPVLRNGMFSGGVTGYTLGTGQQIRFLLAVPSGGITDQSVLARIYMGSSTFSRLDVIYVAGGTLKMVGYRPTTTVGGEPIQIFTQSIVGMALNGTPYRIFAEMSQSGTTVNLTAGAQEVSGVGWIGSRALASTTMGLVTHIEVGPTLNIDGASVGHVVVQNAVTSIFDDARELSSFAGEIAFSRFQRLCDENGIPRIAFGDGVSGSTNTLNNLMAPQRPAQLLALIREAEAVSGGILFDGAVTDGLRLRLRQALENKAVFLAVRADQLAAPLEPTYDDQGRINRAVVTRQAGGTAVAEDVTGPLGTATVGIYDTSVTLPLHRDESLLDYAGWMVNVGTFSSYRHPSVELDLGAEPTLAVAWLGAAEPGLRLSITDVRAVVPQYPLDRIDLGIQGWQQTITPHSWTASLNCTPYEPWRIATVATETGDTGEYVARLDSDGSTVNTAVTAGATSLSVATSAGPLWTRAADDFPLTIEVGGIPVTVTAITGAASPQTFTVTGATVTKPLAAGLAVQLHRPTVLGV